MKLYEVMSFRILTLNKPDEYMFLTSSSIFNPLCSPTKLSSTHTPYSFKSLIKLQLISSNAICSSGLLLAN